MDPTHIIALLAPFLHAPPGEPVALHSSQLAQVSSYLRLLLRWNPRINLTAVRDPEQILTRHFGESFFAARVLLPAPGDATPRLLDLGSGAGFPGLPLKVLAPANPLTLIESNQKKCAFLSEAVRAMALTGVNVFRGRAQDFPATTDLVTLRAVERYPLVLEVAARLVAPAGRLALLIGAAQARHTPALLPAFAWQPPIPIPGSTARVILIGTNLGEQESA